MSEKSLRIWQKVVVSQAYTKPSQTSKIELFSKIVSGFQALNIFAKSFILDVWQISEWTSEIHPICSKQIANLKIRCQYQIVFRF